MLEELYVRPSALSHLRSSCTGACLDAYARALVAQGYRKESAQMHLAAVAHLGRWLGRRGVALETLDEVLLASFVEEVRRTAISEVTPCRRRAAGRRFLVWAREEGVVSTCIPVNVPPLIQRFESWMTRHKNLAAATLANYRLPLRHLVEAHGDEPGAYTACDLRNFILAEFHRSGSGYAKIVVSAVRGFLRYLGVIGLCAPDLVGAVPSVANWKGATLPAYLSRDEVERVLAACDATTAAGQRDHAMMLLMARLGLRNGEVARLRLGDISWADATLSVAGKGRRLARMPLSQEVGDGLLRWITGGRPDCDDDHMFLRLRAPRGPLGTPAINNVVVRAAQRAAVDVPGVGPHMLRHSVATKLVNDGVSLPAIGALLRHQSLDTTVIYAKVDRGMLGSIARPWPSEVS
ncbi:MAG: tyrosine-type recombinase/integrase [bacterium]|nr:tyrosine-type recombinase/integrase [bacterium]